MKTFNKQLVVLIAVLFVVGIFVVTQVRGSTTIGLGALTSSTINTTIETNAQLNESLVGHWTFDGPNMVTNVTDSSSSGNTGYLTQDQGTTTYPGRLGQGIDLDGASDYILINDSASLSFGNDSTDLPFSVSAWVYIDDSLTTQRFVGKADATNDGEWLFTTTGSDLFGFFMFDQSANAFIGRTYSSSLPTGEWIHLTGTYDGSKTASGINLYLDGTDVDDADSTSGTYSAMESTTKEVKIGRYDTTYLDGKVDDVRIYNKELTASEVSRIYDLGATSRINKTLKTNSSLESGLIAHWTFDGPNMVTNVADSSGSGNDGYILGTTATSTSVGKIGQSIRFDGSEYYTYRNINDYTGDYTVAFWTKSDDIAQGEFTAIFSSTDDSLLNNSFQIDFGGASQGCTGKYRFIFRDSGGVNDNVCYGDITTSWEHIAVVVSNNSIKTYQDGSPVITDTPSISPKLEVLKVAANRNTNTYFDGNVDDLRVYSKALTGTEIQRLYDLGK